MLFSEKHTFARVPSTDSDEESERGDEVRPGSSRTSVYRRGATFLGLFVTVILGLTIVSLLATSTSTHGSSLSQPKWSSCGNDSTTARARGCSFDLISFAWQTPECYDGELVEEFASWEGDWSFFADDKFTQPVGQEAAIKGEIQRLFVKWDYHMVHCTFMWRQMHRAYERGWIDAHLGNYNHTLHCQSMMLMDPKAAEKGITVARLIYPECNRVKH